MLHIAPKGIGWIEVICGPMFSGKTEELIRRIRRAEFARLKTIIFKPHIDDRYSKKDVVSHNAQRLSSTPISSADEIKEKAQDAQVIGIDEAQFFGMELIDIAQNLADQGKRVIIAGLDQDYTGKPFEPIPQLLAIAEYITKTLAICVKCGNPANRTQRLSTDSERVVVGATDIYEARCRFCHEVFVSDKK